MVVVQLPHDALAAAVGVQVYSYLCLLCSSLMILLVCKHRATDVALLAYTTFLNTAASIAQQLHTIVRWTEIKEKQYFYVHHHLGSPELALAGGSYGLDLGLFYIQYYCYNAEGILTLFWACSLAFFIYDPSGSFTSRYISRKSGAISKAVALLLPAILIGLLQIPAVKNSTAAFLIIADVSLAASLFFGSIFLVAILGKYIHTRRRSHRWTIRYPLSQNRSENEGGSGQDSDLNTDNRIYDGWLIVRFAIAFLFIEAFQILSVLSELAQTKNNTKQVLPHKPDTSASRARVDFVEFLPGVSTGLLTFLVFGTTRACKHTLYITFVPRKFRRGTTSPDTDAPTRPDHQAGTFLTSTSVEPSSRRASEPNPSQLERRASSHITSCPELALAQPQFVRSGEENQSDNQDDSIGACSFSISDICKSSQEGNDTQGGQSSLCKDVLYSVP
ncbi:hypothetical protein GGR55DRAFT_696948 [Xylaria sp. FL0064]|nr:hypothetical protein GGR55DRAFT_696948 [Xylaria sp. FL0064]